MTNVIQFPRKNRQQLAGMAGEVTPFLKWIGATDQEVPIVLEKLYPRWEALGHLFDMACSPSVPGPLRQDQLDAINEALRAQVTAIADRLQAERIQILYEFAKLELQLLRAGQNHVPLPKV